MKYVILVSAVLLMPLFVWGGFWGDMRAWEVALIFAIAVILLSGALGVILSLFQ